MNLVAPDNFAATFGAVLKEHRAASGFSRRRLGREARMTDDLIRKIERGASKRGGTLLTFMSLAEAMGMRPSRLMAAVEKRIRATGSVSR